jgi:hypothetical protein
MPDAHTYLTLMRMTYSRLRKEACERVMPDSHYQRMLDLEHDIEDCQRWMLANNG